MFKTAALVGIVVSAGFMGIIKSAELKERITLLEDFMQMILWVRGQINYLRQPLLIIAGTERKNSGSEAFIFFDKVRIDLNQKEAEIGQIWAQNVNQTYQSTPLTVDDLKLMEYAGTFIGQSDYENQLAQFEYLETKLQEQIRRAEEDYARTGPLYRRLGFFAGGLAAIIFI